MKEFVGSFVIVWAVLCLYFQPAYADLGGTPPQPAFEGLSYPFNSGGLKLPEHPGVIRAFFFDLDDNVFRTLNRIWLFPKAGGPAIGVFTEEYAELRPHFSEDGQGRSYEYTTYGNQTIDLANYELSFDQATGSFREFGDAHGEEGVNYFWTGLNHAQRILGAFDDALGIRRPGWMGPSYPAFKSALSRSETAVWTFAPTARMHARGTIHDGVGSLRSAREYPFLMPEENIWPVAGPHFTQYFEEAFGEPPEGLDASALSPSAAKALVMGKIIDIINSVDIPAGKIHTAGFSDDDWGNFEKARAFFQEQLDKGRWPHVRITLFFVGLHDTHPPHALVLRPNAEPLRLRAHEFAVQDDHWKDLESDLFGPRGVAGSRFGAKGATSSLLNESEAYQRCQRTLQGGSGG